MSKIICDICGTSYPETTEQCPICGTVRPIDISGVIHDEDHIEERSGYTYVKGGRFSKANVKKRNAARQISGESIDSYSEPSYEREKTNVGLIITAILLFVVIIALATYICVYFLGNNSDETDVPAETQAESVYTEPSTEPVTESQSVPCVGLKFSNNGSQVIRFSEIGETYAITVEVDPVETTDEIFFVSDDASIAAVNEHGTVEAIASGETTIVITCGDQILECYVICDIALPTEETTEPTVEETNPQYTLDDIILNTYKNSGDITISINEPSKVYVGKIPLSEVKIYTEDPSVAKIDGAYVVGVGAGITKLYVEYGELRKECTVRVIAKYYGGTNGTGQFDNPDTPA